MVAEFKQFNPKGPKTALMEQEGKSKLTLFHHINFKDLHRGCKIQLEFKAESRSWLTASGSREAKRRN